MDNAEKGWLPPVGKLYERAGTWPGYMVSQCYVAGGKNYEDDTFEHAAGRDVAQQSLPPTALSAGFDRQRVMDVAWGGIGEFKNATISLIQHLPAKRARRSSRSGAAPHITQDLDGANKALDELGMKKGAGTPCPVAHLLNW